MQRLRTDVMLAETGFGPVFELDSGSTMFASGLFGGAGRLRFSSCRGCGAVVRLGEIIEVRGKKVERGVWEHAHFHARINDPLKAVNEG